MTTWTIEYYAIAFGCTVAVYVGRRYFANTRPTCPLPPGPPGLPWIGNVIGINTSAPWLTYSEWAKTYGDLVYSQILGKDIIIINSEKVAKDLLDKRSSNNSDRPYLVMSDMCGIGFNSALMPYGTRWRLHRRFLHQTFRVDAVARFLPFQHRKACQFLRRLLNAPEQMHKHIFEYTAAIILSSTYDYDPPSHDDELIKLVVRVQEAVLSIIRPDVAMLVDTFPMLLKLPAWFPGMSFKAEMAIARKFATRYVETAFQYSLQRVRGCSAMPFMVRDALQHVEDKGMVPDALWMKELREAAATSFLAGSETSHAVLMSFFLMMVLNPEVQAKAQAQIDAVVGKTRLPAIDDRPLLPLVDAIFWETLRCWPVTPLSVPHASVDDDVYNGFHIPKGSIFFANLWSMTHDESRYPNSHAFMPERFLNEDGSLKENDVKHIVFGFGRRICVGRHLADISVWAAIAKVLAVFKILKPLDSNGIEMPVEPRFSTGMAIHPLPFECRIVPRWPEMGAEKLEELIAASTA